MNRRVLTRVAITALLLTGPATAALSAQTGTIVSTVNDAQSVGAVRVDSAARWIGISWRRDPWHPRPRQAVDWLLSENRECLHPGPATGKIPMKGHRMRWRWTPNPGPMASVSLWLLAGACNFDTATLLVMPVEPVTVGAPAIGSMAPSGRWHHRVSVLPRYRAFDR